MPCVLRNTATRWLLTGLQAAALSPGVARAAEGDAPWRITPRIEYSSVKINDNEGQWRTTSIMLERRLGDGESVFASVQRQRRNEASDAGLQLGGYARIAGWNAMALVEQNPGATFLPQQAYEVQLDHGAGLNRRVGLGYRKLRYRAGDIAIWSPQMTFYRGNDELGISYRVGRNAELDHDIRVLQLRALAIRERNQFGAYLARGNYIFDALGIPGTSGSGWSANLTFSRTLTSKAAIQMEIGQGMESDTFRQRSLGVSLRYSP